MNRTIVCKTCDNNRVVIEKIGQELCIKCSKCKNTIMQAVYLESWNENAVNTYKLRINIDDDRLIEADIIEMEANKTGSQTSSKEEKKIRLMYVKEYEFIRQLAEDEYVEIINLNTLESREIQKSIEKDCNGMKEWRNYFEYECSL